jgi:hypothetical protein
VTINLHNGNLLATRRTGQTSLAKAIHTIVDEQIEAIHCFTEDNSQVAFMKIEKI